MKEYSFLSAEFSNGINILDNAYLVIDVDRTNTKDLLLWLFDGFLE